MIKELTLPPPHLCCIKLAHSLVLSSIQSSNYNKSFKQRNRHCWDWWNLEALSDDEVFEEKEPVSSPTPAKSPCINDEDEKPEKGRHKIYHLRKNFVRAKSAEPESNLSRKKSTSLPDVHQGLVGKCL